MYESHHILYNHPHIKVSDSTTPESTTPESTTAELKTLGSTTAEFTTPDTKPVTSQLTTSSDQEPALNATSSAPTSGNSTTAIVACLLVLLALGLITLFTAILMIFLWRYENSLGYSVYFYNMTKFSFSGKDN